MSRPLEGQVALVTAAGRGIGRGIALALADAGASVALNSFSDETTRATADAVAASGVSVLAHPGDITHLDVIRDMVQRSVDEFGRIDVLVNNVGAAPKGGIPTAGDPLDRSVGLWRALYEQNLGAVVAMTEAVLPHMRRAGGGRVINISSIAGRGTLPAGVLKTLVHPAYGAMKAALISYTHALAEMYGPDGITANAVCPGIVYTDAWRANAEQVVEHFEVFKGMQPRAWFEGIARGDYPALFPATPLRREQTVEDVASAVVFLASAGGANISGQSLTIDGGMFKS